MHTPTRPQFPFHRLAAYTHAIELAAEVRALLNSVPRGYAPISDQLRRAAQSVALNTGEGAVHRTSRLLHGLVRRFE